MAIISRLWAAHRRWFLAIGLFALVCLGAAAFSVLDISWAGWRPAPCMPGNCFCERLRPGPVVQPVNTYSNLSFVLVGLLILAYPEGSRARRQAVQAQSPPAANLMRSYRSYPLVYAISVIVIGLGSLFYHASMTFAGEWFDLFGMYLLATFILLYNLARLRGASGPAFAAIYLGVNALLGLQLLLAPTAGRPVFAALILAALGLETFVHVRRRPAVQTGWLVAAVLAMALAFLIWVLDIQGVLCSPESFFQGHAAWHLLTAAAAGLLFLYYRSEK